MKLLVGIDVNPKTFNVAMLTTHELNPIFQGSFDNDLTGATELKAIILKFNQQSNFDQIIIGMELTSIYNFHPAYFFMNDDDLSQINTETVVINPQDVKSYKDVLENNDQPSVFYIADYLRNNRFATDLVREEEYVVLQRLTRSRCELATSLVHSKQHLLEKLYYKVNKLDISSLDNKVPVFNSSVFNSLTAEMTTDEIINTPTKELIDYLNNTGHGRFADDKTTANTIQNTVQDSYHLTKVTPDSMDMTVSVYATEIRTYKKLIKTLDKEITKMIAIFPEAKILQSFPGIGPVCSAGILAEIGQIEHFENESQIASYAGFGLTRKQHQSDDFSEQNISRTQSGNKYLHYYFIEAAGSVTRYDPVFKKYFEKQMSKVANTPRKRGLTLSARKLIRVIDTLLRRRELYQKKKSI